MSKANQVLFELITHSTYQNQFFHAVFIFIDFYPVLLASLSSLTKISNFKNTLSKVEEKFSIIPIIFPYRYQRSGCENKIVLIFLIVIIFFLFMYYLLIFLLKLSAIKSKNSGAFIQKSKCISTFSQIAVNFYDFFFMRYLSGYITLFLTNLIVCYLHTSNESNSLNSLALVFIAIYVWFLCSVYHHLNTYFVIIQISNESMAKDKGKYPFDILFSVPFDNLLFTLKILVGIEYNYTASKEVIDLFSVVMNLLIVALLVFLTVMYSFQVTSYKKVDNYIFNKLLNIMRMFMTVFDFYFVILTTIFLDKNTHVSILALLFVLSVLWAFFTVLLIWLILIKPQFFNGTITLQKLLYIMVQSKKQRNLVLTTGESFFNINLIKIQDAIEFQHRINCAEFTKCALCKKYTNKEAVTVFDLYKHVIKNEGDNIIHNEVDILYRDLIKLFYYHIKKKIFKFYSWYRKIYIKFDKVDKTIVNNLAYIISLCLSYYDSYNVVTFHEIFQFTNLNQMIENHLENIKNFIACANELKYVDKFFNLSQDIRKLRDYMLYVFQHMEIKDDYSTISEMFTRNVKNIYKYNLLVNRFVVETLTNHHYKELSELNLEMFEEYLTNHYEMDKLLMFNLNMDHENQHNDIGVHNNSYNILKCGKELISYRDKTFVDMMPKKLKKTGLEFFINKLSKFIDYDTLEIEKGGEDRDNDNGGGDSSSKVYNNSKNTTQGKINTNYSATQNNGNGTDNSALYQYIINATATSSEIALLNYSFKVSRSLVDDHMLIYGYYAGLNTMVMLFQMNKLNDLNNVTDSLNMKLENFSQGIKNILMLESEWIDILDKSNNCVYFNTLFKKYVTLKNDKAGFNYECLLDYNHYINSVKHFAKILKEYLDNEKNERNIKNNVVTQLGEKNQIEEKIEKLNEKKGKYIKMRLKLLFEIKVNLTIAYKIFGVTIVHTKSRLRKKAADGTTGEEDSGLGAQPSSREQTFSNDNDSLLRNDFNACNSTTNSMTDGSVSLKLTKTSLTTRSMKFTNAINSQNSQVDKISRAFATFSILIVVLNCLIILVCIIFLIVQIFQTNRLETVNNLNYEFKRIRIAFAHSFLSVFTNGCLAEERSKVCKSAFNDYSMQLIVYNSYPKEYNVRDYLLAEIKYKINDMQSTFYSFKEDVFAYGDAKLLTTLSNTMIYTSFEQKDGELIQQSISVALEEGIRKYINSFSVLVENDFTNTPIYIISFRNSTVDFSNMETQNLSEVQTQIYLILINYINYSTLFMNSEDNLENKYYEVVSSNRTVLLMFMIFVALLNLGLLILCLWNNLIVTKLFLGFIMRMIMVMSDQDFKDFYVERIDNLITLSQLYKINPNHLVHSIKKDESKIAAKLKERNKQAKLLENARNTQTEKEFLLQHPELIPEKKTNTYVDVSKIRVILLPFIFKISILFTIYFIILIGFDVFLVFRFNNLINVNEYILTNFLVETQMYDVLVLTQIMTLLNLTQNDFANSLGIDNPDSDGVINMKIRETAGYIKKLQNSEENGNAAFSYISNFFNGKNCSDIFSNIENNLTALTVNELNVNFYDLQGKLCHKYGIMTLDSFAYMFNDYILRVQKLQNLISSYSYADLYYFNTQYEFFDLITMVLMNLQPIRNYIRTVLLDNLMNKTISEFISLISVYLCVNIVLDICMYIIIKYTVAGKLDQMHRDLLMFSNCFSY